MITRRDGATRQAKKVSAKYLNRVLSALREWFDYLLTVEKVIDMNPANELKNPKIPKRSPPHLSVEEVSRLIQAAVDYSRQPERVRNWALIAFLFHTGLRVSELTAMRSDDIRYKDGLPGSLRVIGKGNKERRVVLNQEAARALWNWLKERAVIEAEAPLDVRDVGYVWLIPSGRKRGESLTPNGVRHLLKRFGKLAGITTPVHPHLLRHSFATEAVRAGAKLHGRKEVLGHASIATTGMYLQADEQELEQVASVMPRVLGRGSGG